MAIKPEDAELSLVSIRSRANLLEKQLDRLLIGHDFKRGRFVHSLDFDCPRLVVEEIICRYRTNGWVARYYYGHSSHGCIGRRWNQIELWPKKSSLWARFTSLWRSRA